VKRAAIVAPVRTPCGLDGGVLSRVSVDRLAAIVTRAVIERSGIHPGWIEDVTMSGIGPHSWALSKGPDGMPLPVFHPDRGCGNGLQAVVNAAMMVQTGAADVVLAGGVESTRGRESQVTGRTALEEAEGLARRYGVSRLEADECAAISHWRAARARERGSFDAEVVPVDVGPLGDAEVADGFGYIVDQDEGIRDDATTDTLAELRPLLPRGVVTVGNMSNRGDSASACLVVAEDRLDDLGLAPMAYFAGWSTAGCDAGELAFGPALAASKLMYRTGVSLDDLDLVELDEGFSVEVLALIRAWDWDRSDRLNVNGSAVSLGHSAPVTGLRIMTTMLHELHRCGGRFAMETVSLGRNHGVAALFEAPDKDEHAAGSTGAGLTPAKGDKRRRVGARFHGA
jgi:acetyl-CoA C-acetyltransferase